MILPRPRYRNSIFSLTLEDMHSNYKNESLREMCKIFHNPAHHRAGWMPDEQWRRAVQYLLGRGVPTDEELREGLKGREYGVERYDPRNRAVNWAWGNTPAFLAGRENFELWCKVIIEHCDPDLLVDEGL